VCHSFVETVDLYPTLCELCHVPLPEGRDGVSLIPVVKGQEEGKGQAFCEWEWLDKKVAAIRTRDYRLVYYNGDVAGELYDHRNDPYEMHNVWGDPAYREARLSLTEQLLNFVLNYQVRTSKKDDEMSNTRDRYSPVKLLHKRGKYWSRLKQAYEEKVKWPPSEGE
jgi:arylsulfatase A-like enzyme